MGETYTLITGAASGFGRSIAQKLAPSRKLVLADINAEKLETVRKTCAAPEPSSGVGARFEPVGGNDEELASFLAAKNIQIDHFVHSSASLEFNLCGANEMTFVTGCSTSMCFQPCRSSGRWPRKGEQGALRSITFISAIGSRIGGKGYYVYSASKGAVNAMSLSLAVELAPGVRVNAVLPGHHRNRDEQGLFCRPGLRGVHPGHPSPGFGAGGRTWRRGGIPVLRPGALDYRAGTGLWMAAAL